MSDVSNTGKLQSNGGAVNTSRRYDSTRRHAQAQQTRRTILESGRALITERGYSRTSMRAVAEEAGVSVETVYLHFRSKPTLLRALLESALGADDDPAPVSERVWVKEVAAQPTARSGIVAFSKAIGTVHAELAPLFIAVRAAAEADTGAAQIWAARTTERLHGMAAFADRLMATGEVRPEATAQDTRDRLFALASPELYGLLVLELHWSPDRYTDWLAETLTQQLLPTAPECVDQAQAAPRTTPGG